MQIIIEGQVFLKATEIYTTGVVTEQAVYKAIKEKRIKVHESEEYGKLIEFRSLPWEWRKKLNSAHGGSLKLPYTIRIIEYIY